jgi:ATP-dependent DNA helicase RecQ/Werner syndrome ATP-dependent helicase
MATDEFDDSFLADFDVDAAVHARPSTTLYTPASSKRLKVTPSPGVQPSSTSLYASPFAENSKFSTGTTTNPQDELASVSFSPPAPVPAPPSSETPIADQKALEATLEKYFGYSKFRPGQLEVLQAVLCKRDAAVFWATGSGKSMCYQIPALHTDGVAIVVSPLISLMQDQCNKLNGLSDQPLATFLGSAQSDHSQEAAALAGKYRLVYVTPEKLLQTGFLNQISSMHTSTTPLSLIAIDESHCVSEWGHDFRPEYRRLHALRNHPVLSQVPIVALTATAVPRVQTDICQSLGLRDPLLARQSFDRTNLVIEVHKKKGVRAAMEPLLDRLSRESTIVYAPTRDQVEEIANYLSTKVTGVEPYHAGLPQQQRNAAHMNFLVGKTKVIVATVAFGMGIDKPDTRRIIHYGPPKTVEEYYQQIGRAGRDGLKAECLMFVSDGDFDRYKGDFYVGGLRGQAKDAMLKSIDALRTFSLDVETCRRKALLNFFHEVPSFGERCGTCDSCQRLATYGADVERDFGSQGARIVLKAIDSLSEQGLSQLEKVINGNVVEPFRYKRSCDPVNVQKEIQASRQSMDKRVTSSHFRELLAPLVTKGYVQQGSKTGNTNGYSVSFLLTCCWMLGDGNF